MAQGIEYLARHRLSCTENFKALRLHTRETVAFTSHPVDVLLTNLLDPCPWIGLISWRLHLPTGTSSSMIESAE
jgi:hypothetical protein